MLYTVIEASKRLSISRQVIYKKIEKMTELKTHIKIKDNVKYIDETGLELIRKSILDNLPDNQTDAELSDNNDKNEYNVNNNDVLGAFTGLHEDFYEGYIATLEDDKRKLFEEIQNKNKQIDALTNALNQSQKLNENNQVLLQQSQQKIFLLEQSNVKKSHWWKRIFS